MANASDFKIAGATGAVLGVTMRFSRPLLDRARYTLSRGEATHNEQLAASALLESVLDALRDA